MKYLSEINAYYLWRLENSVSANVTALWHELMHYCNALSWKHDFSIANTRLCENLEIDRKQLERARNVLIRNGLIKYKSGHQNAAGKYTMVSLCPEVVPTTGHNVSQDPSTLDRKDKDKNREEKKRRESEGAEGTPRARVSSPSSSCFLNLLSAFG